jgi:hypothetical protein
MTEHAVSIWPRVCGADSLQRACTHVSAHTGTMCISPNHNHGCDNYTSEYTNPTPSLYCQICFDVVCLSTILSISLPAHLTSIHKPCLKSELVSLIF